MDDIKYVFMSKKSRVIAYLPNDGLLTLNFNRGDISKLPGVLGCHHFHVWQLSANKMIATLHIQVEVRILRAFVIV